MRHDSRPPVDSALDAQWVRVRARLKGEVGEAAFKSWLKPRTLLAVEDGEIRLAVPTRFMRDWVRTHYADRIRTLWQADNRQQRLDAFVDADHRGAIVRRGRYGAIVHNGRIHFAGN